MNQAKWACVDGDGLLPNRLKQVFHKAEVYKLPTPSHYV